jgi:TPP-dependent pyruvate/acetoin dehydrogenase alpha subunit
VLFREELIRRGVSTAEEMDALEADVMREVEEAFVFTNESPFPDPSVAFDDLYTDSKYAVHTYNNSTFGTLETVR